MPYHQINSLYASVVPLKPYVRAWRQSEPRAAPDAFSMTRVMNRDFQDDFSQDTPKSGDDDPRQPLGVDAPDFANSDKPADDEHSYIDCRACFNSKSQLLCIEPIDKYYVGAHITARGADIDYNQVRHSAINLIVDPKAQEKDDHEQAMSRWLKEANKRSKNQRRYPQYDPDNHQEDVHKFKYRACNCICVESPPPSACNGAYLKSARRGEFDRHMLTLSNNGAIASAFSMIEYRFNKLFSRRAFVANFIDKSINESDMVEAREMVEVMIEGYNDVTDFANDEAASLMPVGN